MLGRSLMADSQAVLRCLVALKLQHVKNELVETQMHQHFARMIARAHTIMGTSTALVGWSSESLKIVPKPAVVILYATSETPPTPPRGASAFIPHLITRQPIKPHQPERSRDRVFPLFFPCIIAHSCQDLSMNVMFGSSSNRIGKLAWARCFPASV